MLDARRVLSSMQDDLRKIQRKIGSRDNHHIPIGTYALTSTDDGGLRSRRRSVVVIVAFYVVLLDSKSKLTGVRYQDIHLLYPQLRHVWVSMYVGTIESAYRMVSVHTVS